MITNKNITNDCFNKADEILKQHPYLINCKFSGYTLLIQSIINNNNDLFNFILKHNPNVNIFTKKSNKQSVPSYDHQVKDAVYFAVKCQNVTMLQKLLEKNPNLSNTYLNNSYTDNNNILHIAAETNNLEIITLLVNYIKDTKYNDILNSKNSSGYTPLDIAVSIDKDNNADIENYLTENGATQTVDKEALLAQKEQRLEQKRLEIEKELNRAEEFINPTEESFDINKSMEYKQKLINKDNKSNNTKNNNVLKTICIIILAVIGIAAISALLHFVVCPYLKQPNKAISFAENITKSTNSQLSL